MSKVYRIVTLDGFEFDLAKDVIEKNFPTIANLLDLADGSVIPIGNVSARAFIAVLKCAQVGAKKRRRYLEGLVNDNLLEVMNASCYLECTTVLEEACTVVAAKMANMTLRQMRAFVGVFGDMTSEEMAKVRADNHEILELIDPSVKTNDHIDNQ
jgi:hypothetical protein